MQKESLKKISLATVLSVGAFVAYAQAASAANFTDVSVRLDRMKAGEATGGTVCAKPVTTATETNVKVTFPSGFTLGASETWAINTTETVKWPYSASSWVGTPAVTGVNGQTVTVSSGDLTVGTPYCFNFTAGLTNGTAGDSQIGSVTTNSGSADIDSSQFALSLVSNDQVVISAQVTPIFTFALNKTADAFTTPLSPSAIVSTTGTTGTIQTNADSGWVAWVKSSGKLASASTGAEIATFGTINDSAEALTNGTNGYGLDVTTTQHGAGLYDGDGVVSQLSGYGLEYDGSATTVGTLSTTFQPIAASSGTTNGDTVTLTERATISAVTPAAMDYTDTLTVIAAGRF